MKKEKNEKPGVEMDLRRLTSLRKLHLIWVPARDPQEPWGAPKRIEEVDNLRLLVNVCRPRDFRLEVEM